MTDLKDKVLKAIHGGAVHMRPRWHYVLRSALIGTGVFVVALALVFVASLIVHSLHV